MTTIPSRRAILAGAAAVPALSLSAIDPIFAAIQKHRAAEAAYVQASEDCEPSWRGPITEETYRLEEMVGELGQKSHEQYKALLSVTPTTVAGVAALLFHICKYEMQYNGGPWENANEDVRELGFKLLYRVSAVLNA